MVLWSAYRPSITKDTSLIPAEVVFYWSANLLLNRFGFEAFDGDTYLYKVHNIGFSILPRDRAINPEFTP